MFEDTDEAKAKRVEARASAEEEHGFEHMQAIEAEYVNLRRRLQDPKLISSEKKDLLQRSNELDVKYGYEVITGAPRVTSGSDPVYDWGGSEADRPA